MARVGVVVFVASLLAVVGFQIISPYFFFFQKALCLARGVICLLMFALLLRTLLVLLSATIILF